MIRSELDQIAGIGEKRKLTLLKAFGGIERIKSATVEELAQVDGMNRSAAAAVVDYFYAKKEEG